MLQLQQWRARRDPRFWQQGSTSPRAPLSLSSSLSLMYASLALLARSRSGFAWSLTRFSSASRSLHYHAACLLTVALEARHAASWDGTWPRPD